MANQPATQRFDGQTFHVHYLQVELILAEIRRLVSDREHLRKLRLTATVADGSDEVWFRSIGHKRVSASEFLVGNVGIDQLTIHQSDVEMLGGDWS